jgi:spore coat protein U-like protein
LTFGGTRWGINNNAVTRTLNFGSGTIASANHTYYLRVGLGQLNKTVGIYDDVLTFSLLQGSASGSVVATSTMTPTISVVSACFVGTLGAGNFAAPGTVAPSALTLNYTSFSNTPVSKQMSFTIDCTQGTPYTLSLSPASGTLLGLPYNLGLSSSAGTGSGFAQSVTVTGTIPAGQSGTCALASCSATQATTVTITY